MPAEIHYALVDENTQTAPPMVAPAPIDTSIILNRSDSPDGEQVVVLQFSTAHGLDIHIIPQKIARRLGSDLQKLGSAPDVIQVVESKLIVPGRPE